MRFQFLVAQRNHANQPLGLRTVIGIVILSGIDLQAHILLELRHFHGVESQFIPARDRWIKVVVEKGIAVAVVGPRPREQNALLVRTVVDVIALVTVLDLVRHPGFLRRKPLGGKGVIKDLIRHRKIGPEHLPTQFDLSVRIEIIGAPIFRDLAGQIQVCPKQVVDGMNKLMPADSTK